MRQLMSLAATPLELTSQTVVRRLVASLRSALRLTTARVQWSGELRAKLAQHFLADDFAVVVHVGHDANVELPSELALHLFDRRHDERHPVERQGVSRADDVDEVRCNQHRAVEDRCGRVRVGHDQVVVVGDLCDRFGQPVLAPGLIDSAGSRYCRDRGCRGSDRVPARRS